MDQETVRTICYLARLKIDEDKAQKIENDLETIIEMIGGLQAFDTENIQPLYSPLEKTASMHDDIENSCLLYTSPSPRDQRGSRMPSSA